MFFAEINDVLVSVPGNVKVEEILSHAQLAAEVDDAFIEVVHLEKGE